MEKISWTDSVRNEEVLHRAKAYNKKKGNWIGHVLRRSCLLKHVFEGKIERKKKRRKET
jgi:hypothetical protein